MSKFLDQQYLTENLEYEDGELFWIKKGGNRRLFESAGSLNPNGRHYIAFQLRARLVWIHHNGDIPADREIDHIDHNRSNDKIENLRMVTSTENSQNKTLQINNISGQMGVSWKTERDKWVALITVNKKRVFLGYFEKIEDAITARKQAEIDYGFHENHGRDVHEN